MKLIESKIGEYSLLIEAEEGNIIGINSSDRNTSKTGNFKNKIYNNIIDEAKGVIMHIASEFGNELINLNPKPNDVEVEFDISLSAETTAWILTANGKSNLRVKIKWQEKN